VYDNYPFDRIKGKLALLVIHGDQDTVNPIAASQKMADAAKAAGGETEYATVPGGTHLEAYLTYASQIFDFLDKHKKQPADPPRESAASVRPVVRRRYRSIVPWNGITWPARMSTSDDIV